jgi:phosphonate degradation associated HDIG domain protein
MDRIASVDAILALYKERGGQHYGEGVSLLEHSLQCAALAQADGASPSLVAAALLHDIGHLFEDEQTVLGAVSDHRHEIAGARALKGLFGDAVRRPIALHVAAKRYLCFREPLYADALSPASQASLKLQGGPLDPVHAAAFRGLPHSRAAIALRRYDDMGKREDLPPQAMGEFEPLLRSLQLRGVNDAPFGSGSGRSPPG